MNPATRTLQKVSIEDAILASETTSLLMGNDVAARKDFIYENAHMAQLDW